NGTRHASERGKLRRTGAAVSREKLAARPIPRCRTCGPSRIEAPPGRPGSLVLAGQSAGPPGQVEGGDSRLRRGGSQEFAIRVRGATARPSLSAHERSIQAGGRAATNRALQAETCTGGEV